MKKTLLLVLAMLMALTPFASAERNSDQMADAVKSFQAFELNGEKVEIGGYLINGNNYYKLRDVAALLNSTTGKFDVKYENKKISLKTGEAYEKLETDLQPMKHDKTKAKMVTNKIMVDGKDVELNAAFIDNNNYVKLRDLGAVVGLEVDFKDGTIIVNTKVEGQTEENVDDKKEEKKDETKSTDPNATPDEIIAFLSDKEKFSNYYSDFNIFELLERSDGKFILNRGFYNERDLDALVKYRSLDEQDNTDKIKAQTKIFKEEGEMKIDFSEAFPYAFIKRERFNKEHVTVMELLNYLNFTTGKEQEVVISLDYETYKLYIPFNKNLDINNTEIEKKEFATISVLARYENKNILTEKELGRGGKIPMLYKDNKSKLCEVRVHLDTLDGKFYSLSLVVI